MEGQDRVDRSSSLEETHEDHVTATDPRKRSSTLRRYEYCSVLGKLMGSWREKIGSNLVLFATARQDQFLHDKLR